MWTNNKIYTYVCMASHSRKDQWNGGSEKDCIKLMKMKKVRIHREDPFDRLRRRDKNIRTDGRIISIERHDAESINNNFKTEA